MPDAEPGSRAISFPCVYRGVQVIATAIARHDQVDLIPVPDVVIEIPLKTWDSMVPFLTVAAHTRPAP